MKTNTYAQPFVNDALPPSSAPWKPLEGVMQRWTAFDIDADLSCLQALDASVGALTAITPERKALRRVTASPASTAEPHSPQEQEGKEGHL